MSHIFATRTFELANVLLGAVFGCLALWGAWQLPVERRILVGVISLGAPLLLLLISLAQPVFLERTVFWVQFIYMACIAIGLLTLPWRRWRVPVIAAAATILVADSVTWTLTTYREPWRDVARVLREQTTPRDAVLFYGVDAAVNLEHYCRTDGGCGQAHWLALAEKSPNEVLPEYYNGQRIPSAALPGHVTQYDRVFSLRRKLEDASSFLGQSEILHSNLVGKDGSDPVALSLWRPPHA